MKYNSFFEYLMGKCIELEPYYTSDMYADFFEEWIIEQDIDDIIQWGEEYGKEKLREGENNKPITPDIKAEKEGLVIQRKETTDVGDDEHSVIVEYDPNKEYDQHRDDQLTNQADREEMKRWGIDLNVFPLN